MADSKEIDEVNGVDDVEDGCSVDGCSVDGCSFEDDEKVSACDCETECGDDCNCENETDENDDTEGELLTNDADDEVKKLKRVVNDLEEKRLRAVAEMENIKRRSAIDLVESEANITAKIMSELLDIIDNFDRAMSVEDKSGET
jgi:molecular chaperone GrpE